MPVAVVTGAGSGIGRATTLALAERGLSVCCVGRPREPLEDTVAQFAGQGHAVAADVGTEEGVKTGKPSTGWSPRTLAGPFFLTQALVPCLAEGAGIIFVSRAPIGKDRDHARLSDQNRVMVAQEPRGKFPGRQWLAQVKALDEVAAEHG